MRSDTIGWRFLMTASVVTLFVVAVAWIASPHQSFGQETTYTYSDGTISFDNPQLATGYENYPSAQAAMQAFYDALAANPDPNHTLTGAQRDSEGRLVAVACSNGVPVFATYNTPAPAPAPAPAACQPNGSCSTHCGVGQDNCGIVCFDESACPSDTSVYTGPAVVPLDAYKVIYSQAPQCSAQCIQSNYLYDSCSNSITYCAQGCVGNSCVVPSGSGNGNGAQQIPPPTLSFTATPNIVQKGKQTHLTWQSTNTTDCQVTGSNGDSFSGTTGDSQSGAINNQTTYTVICTGQDGSTIQKQATVNIIPVFQEV